jgi:hypothetical protein
MQFTWRRPNSCEPQLRPLSSSPTIAGRPPPPPRRGSKSQACRALLTAHLPMEVTVTVITDFNAKGTSPIVYVGGTISSRLCNVACLTAPASARCTSA